MNTTLVLDDFNPRRLVSANRRIHHYLRAEVCAAWRKLAYDAAVAAEQLDTCTDVDGIEAAFEAVDEGEEAIRQASWVGDCTLISKPSSASACG